MDGRNAKPLNRGQMLTNGIALMLREAISRISRIQLAHQRVTCSFGQDRSRGNGQALAVALHDGLLGYWQLLEAPSIDENMLWYDGQPVNCSAHGEKPGP